MTLERKRAHNRDALSMLPFEVLVHIAGFLDSFTCPTGSGFSSNEGGMQDLAS